MSEIQKIRHSDLQIPTSQFKHRVSNPTGLGHVWVILLEGCLVSNPGSAWTQIGPLVLKWFFQVFEICEFCLVLNAFCVQPGPGLDTNRWFSRERNSCPMFYALGKLYDFLWLCTDFVSNPRPGWTRIDGSYEC